jgi:hypothetical protein
LHPQQDAIATGQACKQRWLDMDHSFFLTAD